MSFRNGLKFFELFKFYSSLGIDHNPHVLYVHMTYVYSLFFMFHPSHENMAKRSHYRIMIFYNFGVLICGRIPTLILFYFLHNPTTPILPIYVDQRRPDLEKDTTCMSGMVVWQTSAVSGRTLLAPD